MSVIINSAVFWADWPHANDTTFEVRAESTKAWVSEEQEVVPANESRVVGTGTITALRPTIPAITLPATSAGLDDQTARWTVTLHRTGRKKAVSTVVADFPLPDSFEPTTTWAAIKINKNGHQPLRDTSVYTKVETNTQIALAVGTLNDASTTVKGRSKLSVAPAVAANPIAVGDNDPRVANLFFNAKAYGAIGNGTTDDTVAIQAALTAAQVAGGIVFFPQGDYLISGVGTQIFRITKTVKLLGVPSWSRLLVKSTVPTTTDIIRVAATSGEFPTERSNRFFSIEGLSILSQNAEPGQANLIPPAGTGGRYALRLEDNNPLFFHNVRITDCYFGLLNGDASIFVDGSSTFSSAFELYIGRNIMERGLKGTIGDSVTLFKNLIRGNEHAVDVTFVTGASGFVMSENVLTSHKGVHFANGVNLLIMGNFFEPTTGAGSNGALLDFDGNSAQIDQALVFGNVFQASLAGLNGIRINNATRVDVHLHNNYSVTSPKSAIVATASAVLPKFGFVPVNGTGTDITTSAASPLYVPWSDRAQFTYGYPASTGYKLTPVTFANLPASPAAGLFAVVTDSNTNTWGATIAGGGANVVLAFYNGTNWTVAGR